MSDTSLVPSPGPALPAALAPFADRARDYAANAKSANTRRAYEADWRDFSGWCEAHGARPMPASPAVVISYLIDRAETVKVATLQRRLAAIREAHRYAGYELNTSSTAFRDTWRGLRREHGMPAEKKAPVLTGELRKAMSAIPAGTMAGLRDRALLLLGFAGALRRSELAALEVSPRDGAGHVEETGDGLIVRLGKSKTDQTGEGAAIAVPYGSSPDTCPVRAFKRWLLAAGLTSGPAFRPINRHGRMGEGAITDKAVALIVKRAVEAAALADGLSPAEASARAARVAGHSLRSGLATSAAANNAPGHAIQRQLRHRKFDTTAGYIREGQMFKQNAAGMAGL